jgi:hypothetical protein
VISPSTPKEMRPPTRASMSGRQPNQRATASGSTSDAKTRSGGAAMSSAARISRGPVGSEVGPERRFAPGEVLGEVDEREPPERVHRVPAVAAAPRDHQFVERRHPVLAQGQVGMPAGVRQLDPDFRFDPVERPREREEAVGLGRGEPMAPRLALRHAAPPERKAPLTQGDLRVLFFAGRLTGSPVRTTVSGVRNFRWKAE